MYFLAQLFHVRTGRKFSGLFYLMLTSAILLFLVPIRNIKILPAMVTIPVATNAPVIYSAPNLSAAEPQSAPLTADTVIFAAWAAAAIIFALRLAVQYINAKKLLLKASSPFYDERVTVVLSEVMQTLKISKNIKIRKSPALQSPLLFGIFSPAIILPAQEFSEAELKMVLMHELTHYKHKDILMKLLCSAAACVHWFNPAVYFLRKTLNKSCELFCDESVLSKLCLSDQKDYGRLILSVIEYSSCPGTKFSTSMASSNESLQQRLVKIVSFRKTPKAVKAAGAVLAFMMTVCSLTAFGFEAVKEALPESIKQELAPQATAATSLQPPTPAPTTVPEAAEEPAATETPTITPEPSAAAESSDTPEPKTTGAPLPEETENPVPTPSEQPALHEAIDLCENSCVLFTVSENKSDIVKSDIITVSETSSVYVSRSNAQSTALICIYDADTGEPLYEEKDKSEILKHFQFPLEKGKKIYLTVKSSTPAEENIYIGAKNRKGNSI